MCIRDRYMGINIQLINQSLIAMMKGPPFAPMMFFPPPVTKGGALPKTAELPPHIQILFSARPQLPYVKPPTKPRCRKYDGLLDSHRDYLSTFEDGEPPEREYVETPKELKEKAMKKKLDDHKAELKELMKSWNPKEDEKISGDPLKTLFVARLSFETTEKKLRKEFEVYGPIKSINIVKDSQTGKLKGYAFIEYEHLADFKNAYKKADGRRIDGRKVLVDCERGRVVKDWRPRRFGGGKGETRNRREKGERLKRDGVVERSRSRSKSREARREREREKEPMDRGGRDRGGDRERPNERPIERPIERPREREREREREKENSRCRLTTGERRENKAWMMRRRKIRRNRRKRRRRRRRTEAGARKGRRKRKNQRRTRKETERRRRELSTTPTHNRCVSVPLYQR
eukprot:TRINITY_DN3158_c0_g1_i9.p1 TRINITY_DN3158_c0_g1~~TRINITY_DN3158_c0_g1_i9.p1  ORF type:complete len:431 (-),score=88.74 TRINITY_DN3158_c0_g1_i9:198-1406(-)